MAKHEFEKGHEKLEGSGRPVGAVTQCKEIRAKRRENALRFAAGMAERLALLEKNILEDEDMRSDAKYRLLIDIEKIRQNEVTLSVPSEQSIKMEDETAVKSARRLLLEKSEVLMMKG